MCVFCKPLSFLFFLMGNWLWEQEFVAREGWRLWSLFVFASKSYRASCSALLCCDVCVLSLAWPKSLHLMVYSYSVVQDAVPWGSSHTQYVCERVTERWYQSQFCCTSLDCKQWMDVADSMQNNLIFQSPEVVRGTMSSQLLKWKVHSDWTGLSVSQMCCHPALSSILP